MTFSQLVNGTKKQVRCCVLGGVMGAYYCVCQIHQWYFTDIQETYLLHKSLKLFKTFV